MNRQNTRHVWKLPLALAILAVPVVMYMATYPAGDCDDKAVHFFSAMYNQASRIEQQAFHQTIQPFIGTNISHPRWERTAFRLQLPGTYPLADIAIAAAHTGNRDYSEDVKWGLFATTVVAVIVVSLLGLRIPLGLWITSVTLSLIALYGGVLARLDTLFPYNVYPFLDYPPFFSYVPRGAGALLAIPTVLGIAARKPWVAVAGVMGMFFWHTGLGLLHGLLVAGTLVLFWLLSHHKKLAVLQSNLLLRAIVFGFLLLGASLAASALALLPFTRHLVTKVSGDIVATQLSERLVGVQWTLFVFVIVLGGFLLVYAASQRLALGKKLIPLAVAGVGILLALGVWRAPALAKAIRGEGGFFQAYCREVRVLLLPEQLSELSLSDEPTMFVSFANYFLRNR